MIAPLLALLAALPGCSPEAADPPASAVDDGGTSGTTEGGTTEGGTTEGGTTEGGTTEGGTTDGSDTGPAVSSTRADLRLKRWRQLSLDLQAGLGLTGDEVCREMGSYDCMALHAVPLGGISIENGVFEHPNSLQATTGLAIERVALKACYTRLEMDLEGEPVVFGHVDLSADALSEAEAAAQITELSRRLLARDPLPEETSALYGLHAEVLAEGGTNADWATLACFAVATSTEALTY